MIKKSFWFPKHKIEKHYTSNFHPRLYSLQIIQNFIQIVNLSDPKRTRCHGASGRSHWAMRSSSLRTPTRWLRKRPRSTVPRLNVSQFRNNQKLWSQHRIITRCYYWSQLNPGIFWIWHNILYVYRSGSNKYELFLRVLFFAFYFFSWDCLLII